MGLRAWCNEATTVKWLPVRPRGGCVSVVREGGIGYGPVVKVGIPVLVRSLALVGDGVGREKGGVPRPPVTGCNLPMKAELPGRGGRAFVTVWGAGTLEEAEVFQDTLATNRSVIAATIFMLVPHRGQRRSML